MSVKTKVFIYSREHKHHFIYDASDGVWRFMCCELGGNWSQCTAPQADVRRGTKFDGSGSISDLEYAYHTAT